MNFSVYTWKEEGDGYGASIESGRFSGISGFGDTELEALKEFFTAMIGAIEVEIEDEK